MGPDLICAKIIIGLMLLGFILIGLGVARAADDDRPNEPRQVNK